jgi:hypothetical protein
VIVPDLIEDHWLDLEAQAEALTIRCPRCQVEPAVRCVGLRTGTPMKASHFQRVSAARDTEETT